MEFDPFNEEWMKENQEDIDKQLKNRTSSDNPKDSFQEWRKRFLSKVEKPTPPETQVNFLKFEKVKPPGKILSWKFVKEIHCVVIKREDGIQYFNSASYLCRSMMLSPYRSWKLLICYDSDTNEAVIVFKGDRENFRMLDPMWIVNMSVNDINKLFRHDIFYEDKDAHQALKFQRVACFCFYRGIHA
ncbi:hypothetical protein Hanom_Chr16g01492781 [Helianthus anomalus]